LFVSEEATNCLAVIQNHLERGVISALAFVLYGETERFAQGILETREIEFYSPSDCVWADSDLTAQY
jgi:hypothetical protein